MLIQNKGHVIRLGFALFGTSRFESCECLLENCNNKAALEIKFIERGFYVNSGIKIIQKYYKLYTSYL